MADFETVKEAALELAMDGKSEATAHATVLHNFGGGTRKEFLAQAVAYAYHGIEPETPQQELRTEEAIAKFLKRKTRKAKVLLSINYDKHDLETSVGDCVCDLMHLCAEKGWDFEQQLEKALTHFQAEQTGGQNG